jgi:hypothetical protein
MIGSRFRSFQHRSRHAPSAVAVTARRMRPARISYGTRSVPATNRENAELRRSASLVSAIGAACLGIASLAPLPAARAQVLKLDRDQPAVPAPARAPLTVAGKVKDANDKPVPGAHVVVVTSVHARSARPTGIFVTNTLPLAYECHGPKATDEGGKFELLVPGIGSGVYRDIRVYAAAPGHGFAIRSLRPVCGRQEAEIELRREHIVRGRVIDLKGQPVVGATVRLGESNWWLPPPVLSIWAPATTDDKGLFLISGLNESSVDLEIKGQKFTPQRSRINPAPAESAETLAISVSPPKRLNGQVVFADTGKAAVGARIISIGAIVGDGRWLETRSDADGLFALNPFAPDEKSMFGRDLSYFLTIFPPEDARYTVTELLVPASSASVQEVRVELRRGVLIRGRVTEAGSGKPVAGARVQYTDRGGEHVAGAIEPSRLNTAISAADGRFELPVLPKAGYLVVLGPTPDYIPTASSDQELDHGTPGRKRFYADAIIPLESGTDGIERTVSISLRRGMTLRGRVLGTDDKPAASCVVFSPSYHYSGYTLYNEPDLIWCADGLFELAGCDPNRTHKAYVFDPEHRLGATVELTKKNATEPATVRLQPCGTAKARLVDAEGKPLVNYGPHFTFLLSEGAPQRFYLSAGDKAFPLEADQVYLTELYWELFVGIKSDNDGRIQFPALVPGLTYRIHWPPKDLRDTKPWPHVDFTVGAGEAKDLGVVTVIDGSIR